VIANFERQESNSIRGLQGVNPSVEHFRVFGCAAHVNIPIARRNNIVNKATSVCNLG